jgi:hypothetical protein
MLRLLLVLCRLGILPSFNLYLRIPVPGVTHRETDFSLYAASSYRHGDSAPPILLPSQRIHHPAWWRFRVFGTMIGRISSASMFRALFAVSGESAMEYTLGWLVT